MSLFTITVAPRTACVEYVRGALGRVLPAGRHRRVWAARYVPVDLREALLAVAPQEVLSADGIQVRTSATVRWAVADPVTWLERTADPLATVYLATQVALREALGSLTVEDLGRRGAGMPGAALTGAVAAVAAEVGVQVVEVVVKDVILPAELRAATLELATARQRGAAQLEMARAETAALRSLANGARLLDEHPALARIRLLQAAPAGPRLVLTVADGAGQPGTAPTVTIAE